MLILVGGLRFLRLGLDLGGYLGKNTLAIYSICANILISPAPIVVGCVVPIEMKINWLNLISDFYSEIKARTPGRAPLAFLRGFRLSNKFVIIFTKNS